jgi:hypothetical protein
LHHVLDHHVQAAVEHVGDVTANGAERALQRMPTGGTALVSNLGWLIFGARNAHWFFFVQQIGFTITSVLGIWNWLIQPAMRGGLKGTLHEDHSGVGE